MSALTYFLVIVGGAIGVLVVLSVIGLFLRPDHVATRAATVPRPPEKVYAWIRDLERHPSWRPGVKKVELLPDAAGKPSFREHGPHGKITFVLDEDAPPAGDRPGRLVTRIADDKLPFGGRWIIEIAPAAGGASVTITEEGVVKNPLFRFLSRTVFSQTATLEAYLRALARAV